jgi:hypothetical protein
MPREIYLSNLRLSFPKLVEPVSNSSIPGSDRKYGCDLIFEPGDAQFAKVMSEVGAVAAEKWNDKAGAILQMIQNDRRLRCFGAGAEKIDSKTMKAYEGYEGGKTYLAVSANEDRAPVMIRLDGAVCDNLNTMERQALARKLYGGCYVNVAVSLWAQDNQFGRGIRCQLLAVQFAKDGAPFGEAPPDFTGKFGATAADAPAAAVPPAGFPPFFS